MAEKLLLAMPVDLDQQIASASRILNQSKSHFIREAVRSRLKAMATGEACTGPPVVNEGQQQGSRWDDLLPVLRWGLVSLVGFVLYCYLTRG